MSEKGDKARKALHDMRWGPHIPDVIERQERMDAAIKVTLEAVSSLEQVNANLHEVIDGLEERLLSVLEVAVARGERLGYADEDYRETLAQGDDDN